MPFYNHRLVVPWLLFVACSAGAVGQDTLQTMPRFDRYEKLRRDIAGSVKRGSVNATWAADSQSFIYDLDGKSYKFDLATGKAAETNEQPPAAPTRGGRRGGQRGRGGAPERGRQFSTALSADGKLLATTRNRNVYISDADGKGEYAVTTDGNAAARTKYGIASWVYGEELGVREAMWWSDAGLGLLPV